MRALCIVLVCTVLMFGCALPPSIPDLSDCKTDKSCITSAFDACAQKHGVWEGRNGNINVTILGPNALTHKCAVAIEVLSPGLAISNKHMNCYLPLSGQADSFSISNDCSGALVGFFPEQSSSQPT